MKEIDRLAPDPEYVRPWQDSAACKAEDSAWFFPADTEQRRARLRREARAKAVCSQCPVIQLCRDHALRVEEPAGIWGALTEEERAQLLMSGNPTRADAMRR